MVFHFFERSPADIDLIARTPRLLQFMIESVIEAVSQSVDGLQRESRLYSEEVAVDLSGLVAPVVLWHGERDGIVPLPDMRRRLAELDLIPEEVRVLPGGGHNFTFAHYDEVMRRLISLTPPSVRHRGML
jgi:pimeloyl-ACP methyl ester carboxylesterase